MIMAKHCVVYFSSQSTKYSVITENSSGEDVVESYGILRGEENEVFWGDISVIGTRVASLLSDLGGLGFEEVFTSLTVCVHPSRPYARGVAEEIKKHFISRTKKVFTVECAPAAVEGLVDATSSSSCGDCSSSLYINLGRVPEVSLLQRRSSSSELILCKTDFTLSASISIEGSIWYEHTLSTCLDSSSLAVLSADRRCCRVGRAVASVLKKYQETFGNLPREIILTGGNSVGLDINLIKKSMSNNLSQEVRQFLKEQNADTSASAYLVMNKIPRSYDEILKLRLVGLLRFCYLLDQNRLSSISVRSKVSYFQLFSDE